MKNGLPLIKLNEVSSESEGKLGYSLKILDKVSFEIFPGEFVSVLSPKGAGKTTLFKTIAGIYKAASGEIEFPALESEKKIISYIPSQPSSFPWFSVKQNVEFFIRHSGAGIPEDENRLGAIIKMVGLSGYENHYPDNRSLGFRFRIALARSLASDPVLILIDEPFNEMDERTKEEIYLLLRSIWQSTKKTILFSTSNLQEACFLSDAVILLSKKPSRVLEEIRLKLPVERNLELLRGTYLSEIKEKIETIFEENGSPVKDVLSV